MPAKVNKEECTGCGTCVEECPSEAITIDEEQGCAVVDEDECVDCGACEEACPSQAIRSKKLLKELNCTSQCSFCEQNSKSSEEWGQSWSGKEESFSA
jgi:ferredoxin